MRTQPFCPTFNCRVVNFFLFITTSLILQVDARVVVNSIDVVNEKAATRPDVFFGDLILSKRQQLTLKLAKNRGNMRVAIKENDKNRWTNNVVPFEISTKFTRQERLTIRAALSELAAQSCFTFPDRKPQHCDYLFIEKLTGCWSHLGRVGGRQVLSLGEGCVFAPTIQHELMHTLGLQHEHQRPGRDKFVEIRLENVVPKMKYAFEELPAQLYESDWLDYDFESVTHYPSRAFGRSNAETIVSRVKDVKIRYNTKLSLGDRKRLALLGKCEVRSEVRTKKKCGEKTAALPFIGKQQTTRQELSGETRAYRL